MTRSRSLSRIDRTVVTRESPSIGIVIWSGALGGAELWCGAVARELRHCGVDATVILLTGSAPIADRFDAMGVPWIELGLGRGRNVIPASRRYARLLAAKGSDGALLMTSGYMATCLRLGGYRQPIIGVEHGHVLNALRQSGPRRWVDLVDLSLGARSVTAQVAVSSFMLRELQKLPHHADAMFIPNGVNVDEFAPARVVLEPGRVPVVGWAGRMVAGKGVDDLIRATSRLAADVSVHLHLAGDGPERRGLEELALSLGVRRRVRFMGHRQDMAAFWNECDVGVASSNKLVESFGMSPLEASACGRPVVATRNGGYSDVVVDGFTGRVIEPGDSQAMASAISTYIGDPEEARRHGVQGRTRAETRFSIRACARSYMALFNQPVKSTRSSADLVC